MCVCMYMYVYISIYICTYIYIYKLNDDDCSRLLLHSWSWKAVRLKHYVKLMKTNKMMMMMMMMTTTTTNIVTEASAPLTQKPAIGHILQLVLPISCPNNLSPWDYSFNVILPRPAQIFQAAVLKMCPLKNSTWISLLPHISNGWRTKGIFSNTYIRNFNVNNLSGSSIGHGGVQGADSRPWR